MAENKKKKEILKTIFEIKLTHPKDPKREPKELRKMARPDEPKKKKEEK